MATSTIKKVGFGSAQTINSFPFTAPADGIAIAIVSPPATGGSYLYITENGNNHVRASSYGGQGYSAVFPVKRGSTYAIYLSANINVASVTVYPIA